MVEDVFCRTLSKISQKVIYDSVQKAPKEFSKKEYNAAQYAIRRDQTFGDTSKRLERKAATWSAKLGCSSKNRVARTLSARLAVPLASDRWSLEPGCAIKTCINYILS